MSRAFKPPRLPDRISGCVAHAIFVSDDGSCRKVKADRKFDLVLDGDKFVLDETGGSPSFLIEKDFYGDIHIIICLPFGRGATLVGGYQHEWGCHGGVFSRIEGLAVKYNSVLTMFLNSHAPKLR